MSKYHAQKVVVNGEKFDSKREYSRWLELRLLQRAGTIQNLQRQVKYELVPKQDGERSLSYIADFTYTEDGEQIVEDCKGFRTPEYKIKRKLMLWVHGIKIKET